MCQAAPLPRCSSKAKKKLASLLTDAESAQSKLVDLSEEIQSTKRANRGNLEDPKVVRKLKALTAEHDLMDKKKKSIEADMREQQLQVDASPQGIKILETKVSPYVPSYRLDNAKRLAQWHDEMRNATDIKGIRFIYKESDPTERKEFYLKELAKAKSDYEHEANIAKKGQKEYESLGNELIALQRDERIVKVAEKQKEALAVTLTAKHKAIAAITRANYMRRALKEEENKQKEDFIIAC